MIPAGLCKDSMDYRSRTLGRENGAKGYRSSLRHLGLLSAPQPGKTWVWEGQIKGQNSPEGINSSRWDSRVTQSQATRWLPHSAG